MAHLTPLRLTLQSSDPWHALPQGLAHLNISLHESENERRVMLPALIADGALHTIRLRDGLMLSISDVQPHVPVLIDRFGFGRIGHYRGWLPRASAMC